MRKIPPYQEGIISETYERPDKPYIRELQALGDLLDTSKLVKRFLPKQTDIDKSLEVMQKSVKRNTFAINNKKIQAGYLTSPYFKDVYLYLAQNKLPGKTSTMGKVEALAERLIPLDSLLFKLVATPEKETVFLAIPEICTDKIITLYHSSLFAGHQGEIKISYNWGQILHTRSYALLTFI